ncbi:MAG: hypothetical protein N3A69_10615, partial [Leptospiraceae bacterium]|nr:hypothetical protein [Leptospiraceae bacterium]
MKQTILFFLSITLLFHLLQCSSTQEKEQSETAQVDPKTTTSVPTKRESSGEAEQDSPKTKTTMKEIPTEVVDLNQIQIFPMPNPESKLIKITKNKEGNPVALLSLETSSSGLDLVDSILKGEIVEHAVVIRNEKGEEIGRAPVNVMEYEIEEIATNKGEKKILLTESGAEIDIKKSTELPPIVRKAKVRTFGKNELIPQYIEINKNLKEGSFISVNLELLYVKPFAEMDCSSSESPENQEFCSKDLYQTIQSEIQSSISEKESILNKAVGEMKEDISISKDYREQLAPRLRKNTNKYRSEIKSNVSKLNNDKLKAATTGKYYYREWRLVSIPKYFQVTYAEPPMPERKKKVLIDYTYFNPNETSTEAIEAEQMKNKDIVIEVNAPKQDPSNISSNQTQDQDSKTVPQDAQRVSLEQAQKQDIGVGSNCIIYLKQGKFFRGKIVSLEGYSSILVEVSGNVIEVQKKDIEVIYVPK